MPLGRKWLGRLAAASAVLVCLWLLRGMILEAIARPIIVDQESAEADYVWIRSGDRCYDVAARLYHQQPARRVLLIERHPERLVQIGVLPSFDEVGLHELEARGVPQEAVLIVPGSARTPWQEARLLRRWMSRRRQPRILLICDRFRSAYERFVLDSVLPPDQSGSVTILALPDRRYDEANWWKSRTGLKELFYAYLALGYARLHGEDRLERAHWDPDTYAQRLAGTVK